jgi:hypothetical protein
MHSRRCLLCPCTWSSSMGVSCDPDSWIEFVFPYWFTSFEHLYTTVKPYFDVIFVCIFHLKNNYNGNRSTRSLPTRTLFLPTHTFVPYQLVLYVLWPTRTLIILHVNVSYLFYIVWPISVITKLPNSEQSYKGKVKAHKYINRQNQSTMEITYIFPNLYKILML